MDVKFILNKIKMEQNIYSDIELAKLLKVSPSAVSNWKARRSMPISTIHKYCKENNVLVEDYIENNSSLLKSYSNNKIKIKNKKIDLRKGEGKVNVDSDYIIELQKDKIKNQKKEIKNQKKEIFLYKEALQKKQAESTHWDGVEYDFTTKVKLIRNGFRLGRTITSVSNLDIQAKMLGYNENELNALWSVKVEYDDFNEHPVNTIICNNTKKEMRSIANRLPSLLDALKLMVGEHYIPVGINYINKDGSHVPAISYNKVMWINLTIISKIKFLTIDNE